jgi:hypothetical protein
MAFFSIGYPEKERIQVTFIDPPSRSHPGAYAWTKARVIIDIDGFTGDVEIYMDISDMVRFKTELEPMYKNVAGKAEFKTIEDQLYIRLEMDNLGHVQVSGFLSDSHAENKLSFDFSFDQTILLRTISEIDGALSILT